VQVRSTARRVFAVMILGAAAGLSAEPLGAQALPDPARAKALDKCHILLERTGAKFAVKKLKALEKCVDGVHKCLQTKPGDARCISQARERCEEQLPVAAAEEAKLVDVVVRKCGSDLAVADLIDPAGLDFESLRNVCEQQFGIALDDLAGVGTCLARQHACELEKMFTFAAPRAASLLEVAGVDPAARSALTCLTNHGGTDEHVPDPKAEGRPLERCARAIKNTGLKLVDASLKATGRCLDTVFTCVQVKHDPAASPACLAKAQKRCDVEFANLAAAATRPEPALVKACGAIDFDVLRSPAGLRLEALAADCAAIGGGDPTTLAAFADCLVRSHRCGVATLARFKSPRADALLALVGHDLTSALCASGVTPTPTVTPPQPTASAATPSITATPTGTPTALPTPTSTASPGCADVFEPNAYPATPANLNGLCPGGGCTIEGGIPMLLDESTNNGTGSETVEFDPDGPGDQSGTYGIEVRRVAGSSCESYRLEIEDPS
jgi:hypothetical protein